jgi:hypothetical protein
MIGNKTLTGRTEQLNETVPGMAYFAGTGPSGKTCGDCEYFGSYRTVNHIDGKKSRKDMPLCCDKYRQMVGKVGEGIKPTILACKYFEER